MHLYIQTHVFGIYCQDTRACSAYLVALLLARRDALLRRGRGDLRLATRELGLLCERECAREKYIKKEKYRMNCNNMHNLLRSIIGAKISSS
jgi:hypothetical protein